MKHSDFSSKDVGNFNFSNSANKQQNDASIDRCNYSEGTLQHQNMETKSHEGNPKGIVPHSTTAEKARPLTGNITDANIQPFAPLESERKRAAFDCTMSTPYSWTDIPKTQLKKEQKPVVHLDDNFNLLPFHGKKHNIQVDQSQSIASISSTPSITEQDVAACIETKPRFSDYKKDYTSSVSSIRSSVGTFPFQPGNLMMNDQPSQPISTTNFGLKTQSSNNLSCISDLESYQRNLLFGGEAASAAPLDEDLYFYWHNMNFGQPNIGMSEYYDPGLLTEVPNHLYDSADYLVIDQGLFIA
ncbi:two-component response regulator ARR11-like [Trifolium medium]|uniref:Two-component response regulator ARR11-like n=1 Tax=Trifolium medium TaxID=97028 RepID=A0A392N195_9FABA|nr:two-component response regulator ARR11-like [Trifolium medium]